MLQQMDQIRSNHDQIDEAVRLISELTTENKMLLLRQYREQGLVSTYTLDDRDGLIQASKMFPVVVAYWQNEDQIKVEKFKNIFDQLAKTYQNLILFAHLNSNGIAAEKAIPLDFFETQNVTYGKIMLTDLQDYNTFINNFHNTIIKLCDDFKRNNKTQQPQQHTSLRYTTGQGQGG